MFYLEIRYNLSLNCTKTDEFSMIKAALSINFKHLITHLVLHFSSNNLAIHKFFNKVYFLKITSSKLLLKWSLTQSSWFSSCLMHICFPRFYHLPSPHPECFTFFFIKLVIWHFHSFILLSPNPFIFACINFLFLIFDRLKASIF